MRRGGVSMRGACLKKTGGTKAVSYESGSSSSNRLRTINGKIVRMRGKGDGSRAYMYPGGRKPIGFGVSWDPVDGEAMLGVSTYLGTNLLDVGMDANNQIIPLAMGISQGETVETWSWFMTKFKECIGEVPNMAIISDRHYAISIACRNVFPKAFHGYDGEDEPLADELSRWVAAKGKSENAKKCDVDCAQYRKVQGLPS
ncbi:transposase, MuDR, MULE transposase domain protein [Tanacetum coccineum]